MCHIFLTSIIFCREKYTLASNAKNQTMLKSHKKSITLLICLLLSWSSLQATRSLPELKNFPVTTQGIGKVLPQYIPTYHKVCRAKLLYLYRYTKRTYKRGYHPFPQTVILDSKRVHRSSNLIQHSKKLSTLSIGTYKFDGNQSKQRNRYMSYALIAGAGLLLASS